MKNWKKYAAIAGVAVLVLIFCLPMYFALKGDFSQNSFMASIFAVMFVAVMAYAMLMLFRVLNKKKTDRQGTEQIKNVVFDLGRVLVDYNWRGYLETFGFSEEKFKKIADATFLSPVWAEMDRGTKTYEEYVEEFVAQAPEYEKDIREVIEGCYKSMHRMPYAETWVKYLKQQGYGLYVISNYGEYTRERTRKEMPFLKEMDGIVFSCDVQQIKPEPEIYQVLLERYQLVAGECVFIDDMEVNCEGARAQGMHAICFKSFKQAAAELEKLGVK